MPAIIGIRLIKNCRHGPFLFKRLDSFPALLHGIPILTSTPQYISFYINMLIIQLHQSSVKKIKNT